MKIKYDIVGVVTIYMIFFSFKESPIIILFLMMRYKLWRLFILGRSFLEGKAIGFGDLFVGCSLCSILLFIIL